MSAEDSPRVGQAGTVESMDCMVTVSGTEKKREIEISGSSAARFKGAIEAKIDAVLDELQGDTPRPVKVSVQDNGALDIVLGARVEAAYRRFVGGDAK